MPQSPEDIQIKVVLMLDGVRKAINARVRQVLASGAVDLSTAQDNYELPRLLLIDALRYVADDYAPATWRKRDKALLKNLAAF